MHSVRNAGDFVASMIGGGRENEWRTHTLTRYKGECSDPKVMKS